MNPVFGLLLLGTVLAASSVYAETTITTEQRSALGIETTPLAVRKVPKAWQASAEVVDSGPLLTTLSDLRSAREAERASEAELERAQRLFDDDTNIARKTLDAARVQRVADRAKVVALLAQLRTSWGPALAATPAQDLARLEQELASGRRALVRIDLASEVPVTLRPPRITLATLDREARHWPATVIGPLPRSPAGSWGGALLVRADAPLVSGQLLSAELREATATVDGISVPADAIVRWRGEEWFYEEASAGRFVRRSLQDAARESGQRLLPSAHPEPTIVVTQGARSLLAAELGREGAD